MALTIGKQITAIAEALKPASKKQSVDPLAKRARADKLKGLLQRYLDGLHATVEEELSGHPQAKIDHVRAIVRAADEGHEDLLQVYGLDVRLAWLQDILKVMVDGHSPIELQACLASPEIFVDPKTGKTTIQPLRLTPEDEINVELTLLLQAMAQICGEAMRPLVIVNDRWDAEGRHQLTPEEQDYYVQNLLDTLNKRGVLRDEEDESPVKYLLDRYSRSAGRVDMLITSLRNSNNGSVTVDNIGNVYFKPSQGLLDMNCITSPVGRWEAEAHGILLRDSKGQPADACLNVATFTDELNRLITHIVPLERRHLDLQDQVYTLLRAIGYVQGDRYHNIFFDAKVMSPALTAYSLGRLFLKELQVVIDSFTKYNSWQEIDYYEYAARNFGNGGAILPEDQQIIAHAVRTFKNLGLPLQGLERVADVGSGPNLYPAMLLTPYVKPGANIELLEYSPNRTYLQRVIEGSIQSDHATIWQKFEHLMVECGGDRYQGCEAKAKQQGVVRYGDIFALPTAEYDFISSSFVTESIVDTLMPFCESIRSLAGAVKPGGIIMNTHMMASQGWPAGVGTHFPAVSLTEDRLRQIYLESGLDIISFEVVGDNAGGKPREGYHGMAIIVATRR